MFWPVFYFHILMYCAIEHCFYCINVSDLDLIFKFTIWLVCLYLYSNLLTFLSSIPYFSDLDFIFKAAAAPNTWKCYLCTQHMKCSTVTLYCTREFIRGYFYPYIRAAVFCMKWGWYSWRRLVVERELRNTYNSTPRLLLHLLVAEGWGGTCARRW